MLTELKRGPLVFAIDPGTTESGWVIFNGLEVEELGIDRNENLLEQLLCYKPRVGSFNGPALAIEMVASYGMAVGREVFETCVWVGRFMQAWPQPEKVMLIYRQEVKLLLTGQTKAKDANIRQAILDLFPATGGGAVKQVGTSKQPGPLFGMNTHTWPALGVAMAAQDKLQRPIPQRKRVKLR